jgi:hypothetical protein
VQLGNKNEKEKNPVQTTTKQWYRAFSVSRGSTGNERLWRRNEELKSIRGQKILE